MKNNIISDFYTIIALSELREPKQESNTMPTFYYSSFFSKKAPDTTVYEIGH